MTRLPLSLALGRNAAAPSIVSAGDPPIGFGAALSDLDIAPGLPGLLGLLGGLVAVEDNAYSPTRVLSINPVRRPALLTSALTVTKDGTPAGYDAEGIATRPGGGYWIAAEGNGRDIPNLLVEVDASGAVVREVALPPEIAATRRRTALKASRPSGAARESGCGSRCSASGLTTRPGRSSWPGSLPLRLGRAPRR